MEATIAAIVALSDAEREIYRAALAFDAEALRRADASRAATDERLGGPAREVR